MSRCGCASPTCFYVRYEKVGGAAAIDEMIRLEVAPDLVVEVLSPSDTLESLQAKWEDYHTLGVPEVWLVDLVPNHVFVLWREEDGRKWNEPAAGEKPIPSRQFPHLPWLPKALFQG